jgi:hypothetical protein
MDDFYIGGVSVKLFLPIFKMFTKYLVVVDDECLRTATNMHKSKSSSAFAPHRPAACLPAEVLAKAHSLFTIGPSDVLDHAIGEIASGNKPGTNAKKKRPGEGFNFSLQPH